MSSEYSLSEKLKVLLSYSSKSNWYAHIDDSDPQERMNNDDSKPNFHYYDISDFNNINLLKPNGQFGTRLLGGKDSASPRYIFTQLSEITKYYDTQIDPMPANIAEFLSV